MPSADARGPSRPARLYALLRSQGIGIICGQAAVGLLAVGSLVIAATRDGASAAVGMDDLTAFFVEPSGWHVWLYGLLVIFALYALNTTLATLDSLLHKWRSGVRSLAAYGPAVVHVGFLVALVAHLVGGLFSAERGGMVVGRDWRPLGDGRSVRLVGVETDTYANGQTRAVRAEVELRDGSGPSRAETVEYNAPLSRGAGSDLWLLARAGADPVARLSDGIATCTAANREPCRLGSKLFHVGGIYPGGHWGDTPAVRVLSDDGEQGFVLQGRETSISDTPLALLGVEERPRLVLRGRYAPGNPIALAASLILLAGMVMMGRRWFRRAARDVS